MVCFMIRHWRQWDSNTLDKWYPRETSCGCYSVDIRFKAWYITVSMYAGSIWMIALMSARSYNRYDDIPNAGLLLRNCIRIEYLSSSFLDDQREICPLERKLLALMTMNEAYALFTSSGCFIWNAIADDDAQRNNEMIWNLLPFEWQESRPKRFVRDDEGCRFATVLFSCFGFVFGK